MMKSFKTVLVCSLFLTGFMVPSVAQTVEAKYLDPQLNNGDPYRFLRFGNSSKFWAGFMWNNSHSGFGDGDDFSIFTYGGRDLTLRAGEGNIVLHPIGTGNVGIGTKRPKVKLEVIGRIRAHSIIQTANPSNKSASAYLGWKNNVARIRIGGNGAGATNGLDIQTIGDASLMRILHNGRVGIGTTNPSTKLTVTGTAKAKEVIVEEDVGADFVFEEDYTLPDLFELESFIQTNKRLPDIPSAEQMKRDGVKIGNLQMKLLQKIEELTLYVIEQREKIKQQEARIRRLEEGENGQ